MLIVATTNGILGFDRNSDLEKKPKLFTEEAYVVVELTQYNSYHSFSNVMPKIYVQICETVLHAQSVKNDSNNIEIEYAD